MEYNLDKPIENEYEDFLDSISYMIPDIIKQKKIKKLNSLQEYLLSSFVVNEDKYELEIEFDLNTKKRFIKKELIGLRIKVGTNKFYYVNNFNDFFDAFMRSEIEEQEEKEEKRSNSKRNSKKTTKSKSKSNTEEIEDDIVYD